MSEIENHRPYNLEQATRARAAGGRESWTGARRLLNIQPVCHLSMCARAQTDFCKNTAYANNKHLTAARLRLACIYAFAIDSIDSNSPSRPRARTTSIISDMKLKVRIIHRTIDMISCSCIAFNCN